LAVELNARRCALSSLEYQLLAGVDHALANGPEALAAELVERWEFRAEGRGWLWERGLSSCVRTAFRR
jgi:hypothetical protein